MKKKLTVHPACPEGKRTRKDPLVTAFVTGLKETARKAIADGAYRTETMFPEWATDAQVNAVASALKAEGYTVSSGRDSRLEPTWMHVGAPLTEETIDRLAASVKARWQPILSGMSGDNHRWLEVDETMPRQAIIKAVQLAVADGFVLEENRYEGDHWYEVWRADSKQPRKKYGKRYHAPLLTKRIGSARKWAEHLRNVLRKIRDIGPQGSWLGSRSLGPGSLEYIWCAEAARLLALRGFAAKTGGGFGLMEAPHYGCFSAGQPQLSIAVRAAFLASEDEVNEFAANGGQVFDMLDFNSRHDVLFLGSMFHIVCPGRLGTDHELKDLLNRLKHRLLDKAPVYFIERNGYWSNKVDFMTTAVTDDLGPRTSPSDFAHAKIVDIIKTTPEEFVQMVLLDLEKAQTAAFQAV